MQTSVFVIYFPYLSIRYGGMVLEHNIKYDVFISFSFADQATVDRIVNLLTNVYDISCWICTEEIRAGENFRKDLAVAINSAGLVVLVQSKHSAVSKEVSKEILFALKKGKMVKPFVIEESELADELEFELSTTHYIDATRPELDDRIMELAKDICHTLGKPFTVSGRQCTSAAEALQSTPAVIPKTVFCGRESVLNDISAHFRSGERVLFLRGMGGIGKTQIAKQYAKRFRDDYDVIIYATYNGSLRQLLIADGPFTIEPPLARYNLPDGSIEDDNAFFARKLDKIKKLSSERTLIILDNFDVEQDADLPLLTNGKYRLLVTTRCDYSRLYPTFTIHPIDSMEELKQLFFQNYDGFDVEEDDPNLEKLIEMVNRHTYTVELLAQHMESSGQTVAEMIAALQERGILSIHEKVTDAEMKTQVAYENLLRMFSLFALNDAEQKVLMYLSLMPLSGVNARDFKRWAELSGNTELRSLERKGWIVKNTDGIALHPIIRDVVKHKIEATVSNCRRFIDLFTEDISETYTWHMKKQEKDRFAHLVRGLLQRFPQITEDTLTLYQHAESLLSFAVDPQYAAVLAARLWDYAIEKKSETSYEAGHAAYKRGWLYAYNSHLPDSVNQACEWLGRAAEIMQQITLETESQMGAYAQVLTNLSKMNLVAYEQSGSIDDYNAAVAVAETSIAFCKQSFQPHQVQYSKVAGAHWQLADALCAGGEYERALHHINISLDILIARHTENDSDSMFALYRRGCIRYEMGEYDVAEPELEKSTRGYVDFFGIAHPNLYQMHRKWGDCCVKLNNHTKAAYAYGKALETAKLIFAPGSEPIITMQKYLAEQSKYC